MERYDVVVVGAGTAGIPCAIEAAATRRVLVVERTDHIGGTLAVSAGQMSAAGTRRQRAAGIEDHPDLHLRDVLAIGGGAADPRLVRLAVDEAPRVLDWLDDLGFDFDPETPAVYRGHTPYSRPRTYWGRDRGRSILDVLRPLWDDAVSGGRIEVAFSARVVGLETDGPRVVGVRYSDAAGERVVAARHVVLATGGYGADPELFAALTPGAPRLVTNAVATATGDGLRLATEVGGAVRFGDRHTPRLGLLEDPPGSGRVDFWTAMLWLNAADVAPQGIWVDRSGRRFVAEDLGAVTEQEHAVAARPGGEMWVVLDAAGLDRMDRPPVRQWSMEAFHEAAARGELVQRADSLAGLAERAGVDATGLEVAVAAFNEAHERGVDDLGRTTFLGRIATPPFYAVRVPAAVLCTFGGVHVDGSLRALRADGSPIEGLQVVGEAIGMGATSGRAFCGGMGVTPALAFGRLVGRRLAEG